MFRNYVAGNLISYQGEVFVVIKASLKKLNLRSFFDDNRTITLVGTKSIFSGCIISNSKVASSIV